MEALATSLLTIAAATWVDAIVFQSASVALTVVILALGLVTLSVIGVNAASGLAG